MRSSVEKSVRILMNSSQLARFSLSSRPMTNLSSANNCAVATFLPLIASMPSRQLMHRSTINKISSRSVDSLNPSNCRRFSTGLAQLSPPGTQFKPPSSSRTSQNAPLRTVPLLSSKLRRRRKVGELQVPSSRAVVGFAIRDEFNMTKLFEKLQLPYPASDSSLEEKRLYEPLCLDEELEEEVLYARAIYQHNEGVFARDVFFFADGAVVFWNMADSEQKAIMKILDDVTETPEPKPSPGMTPHRERDFLTVNHTLEKKTSISKNGRVSLSSDLDEDEIVFVKYAISNALAQSVKLGVWEEMLSTYIDSIQHIAEDLRMGRNPKLSQRDVLVKTGEFFALKHLINLDSDLLDVPDFYWDRTELEKMYQKAFLHFNISKRTSVMNERLAHCVELTEMMSTNFNHKHASRLETIIIWLIAVEVVIEFFHLFEKYYIDKKSIDNLQSTEVDSE